MIHLLIDENLPASLAEHLPVSCAHATDLGAQLTDHQLWAHARDNQWIILTRDSDFFDRLMLDGPPPKVVWVRLGNIRRKDLEAMMQRLWPRIASLLVSADLIEVHPGSVESFRMSED